MSRAPTIKITDPKDAVLKCELSIGGWDRIRRVADEAECGLVERRVGFITKEFAVTGDEPALNRFVHVMWDDDLLGRDFRVQLRAASVSTPGFE